MKTVFQSESSVGSQVAHQVEEHSLAFPRVYQSGPEVEFREAQPVWQVQELDPQATVPDRADQVGEYWTWRDNAVIYQSFRESQPALSP